jgi:predicted nucleotide-binding protein
MFFIGYPERVPCGRAREREKGMVGTPSQQQLGKKFFDPFINWPDDTKLREWLREQDPDEIEQFLDWFNWTNYRDRERLGRQELATLRNPKAAADQAATAAPQDRTKVFVVHGHDGAPKAEVARFIEKLGLEAIILHERPNKGRPLITKFREEAAGVGFAVVLMTPDDLGKAEKAVDLNLRARQNVVFELGFFIGKLGPENVAALVKGDIELPSDFDGVVYISLDKEDWQAKLGGELQAAGYEIDWNKVMRR